MKIKKQKGTTMKKFEQADEKKTYALEGMVIGIILGIVIGAISTKFSDITFLSTYTSTGLVFGLIVGMNIKKRKGKDKTNKIKK